MKLPTNVLHPAFHFTAQKKGDPASRKTLYVEGYLPMLNDDLYCHMTAWYLDYINAEQEVDVEIVSIDLFTTR
jgi:hypothetical protein